MNNIKMITLFHPHDKTPFMICIVNKVDLPLYFQTSVIT